MHYNSIPRVQTWGSESFMNIAIKRVKWKNVKIMKKPKGFSLAPYTKTSISRITHVEKKMKKMTT